MRGTWIAPGLVPCEEIGGRADAGDRGTQVASSATAAGAAGLGPVPLPVRERWCRCGGAVAFGG